MIVEVQERVVAESCQGANKVSTYLPLITLYGLTAFVIFWRLGNGSLVAWDEATYAQVSKEIVLSGNWLTLDGVYGPFLEKPPLFLWTTAILYKLFGVNEFWSRAASALFGTASVGLTYLIGRSLYDRTVGLFAGVVLLTTSEFVFRARFGALDMMLTFFMLFALYGYLRLQEGNEKWWYVIWVSWALGFMVKGPASVVAPAAVGLAIVVNGDVTVALRSRKFWGGIVAAFCVVVPWHFIMLVEHGQTFVAEYLDYHIISRVVSVLDDHRGGRLFYVHGLRTEFFPWFYLVPFALVLNIRDNIRGKSKQSHILLLYSLVVFGLYTVVRTKIGWYVFPVYPALAILTGSLVVQAGRNYRSAAFSGLLLGSLLDFLMAPVALVLVFGGAISLVGFRCIRSGITSLSHRTVTVLACAFIIAAGVSRLPPLYTRGDSAEASLGRLAASVDPDNREPLIVVDLPGRWLPWPTIEFYSGRSVQRVQGVEELANYAWGNKARSVFLSREDLGALLPGYSVDVVAEAGGFVYGTIRSNNL